MANRIKGITVEIGGDTTKLQDALKKVNTEIKHTQSELRDVNKLLKLDPGNTELISQKQKLLGDAIENTKKKLESLKLASEQANKALANGEITASQYDALQREIIETENALKSLETQAKETSSSLKSISDASMNISEKTGKLGKNLTKKLTVPILAIGAAGIKTASNFEKAMSGVKAITNANEKDFSRLKDQALELGQSTKFSASEVADAMTEMAKAGWSTEEILSGLSGVLDATASSGENLGSVSTIVADAITGFNMNASESSRVADVLTKSANAGTIGINDLGESFKYIAPISSSMGFSIEEVTAAITAMSMSGVKGSQAGTSLKNAMTNLVKPTKAMQGAMDELGIEIANQDGSFKSLDEILSIMRGSFSNLTDEQKVYYATILAGKEGQAGLLSLLNLTQTEYDGITDSMRNANGVAKETANIMQDNLSSKFEELGGALETLAVKFGDLIIPKLTEFVEKITDVINSISNADPVVKELILGFAGFLAAVGPLLLVISKLAAGIGTVTGALSIMKTGVAVGATPAMLGLSKVFGVLKAAIGGLVSLISAHPIIAAIVAACAILIPLIIKYWEDIKAFFVEIWNEIVESATAIWNVLSESFSKLWASIKEECIIAWQGLSEFLTGLWTGIVEGATSLWGTLTEFFSNLWNGIKDVFINTWNAISETITSVITSVSQFITNSWNSIKEFFTSLWESIKTIFTNAWNGIKETVTNLINSISEFIKNIWNSIKEFFSNLLNGIKNTFTTVWNSIKTTVVNLTNSIKTSVSNTFNNMWNGIKNTVNGIYNSIKSGFNKAVSFIKGLVSNAFSWGADMINGIVNGIKSAVGGVVNAVKGVAGKIRSFLHFSVPDEGPLTDYESWMPDFMQGLAKGIERSRGLIQSSMKNVATDMILNPSIASVSVGASHGQAIDIAGQIKSALSSLELKSENTGDIVIPVYVGGRELDKIIVTASQRQNLRSGGR